MLDVLAFLLIGFACLCCVVILVVALILFLDRKPLEDPIVVWFPLLCFASGLFLTLVAVFFVFHP